MPAPLSQQDRELQKLLSLGGAAPPEPNSYPFNKIGAGSCGAVFAQPGSALAFKLSKTTEFSLWNDYLQHTRIRDMLRAHNIDINIPDCHGYIRAEDAAATLFDKTPALADAARDVCHLPTRVLVTQRINPLPPTIRTLLTNKYCAPRIKANALADPANRDCLVRVYLGSMAGKTGGGMFFSLRNFKLHLNHIIDLQLNLRNVCVQMARSLAIMHWAARTDARDVEFVLGSSAGLSRRTPAFSSAEIHAFATEATTFPSVGPDERDFFCSTTQLWLLDFNLVQDIELNDNALDKLVSAHNANDPYYPKPCQEHPVVEGLWNDFATAYLDTAALVLQNEEDSKTLELPSRFIEALISQEHVKKQTKEH
ncbi:zinc finger protein-domain-containing protein [Microdochium trichocladiopsis]|uniref:Zinc finger protein-domain-containing protein n=1 Tax=Microdochium trichocladiopsis TaxID=1682393 RepID=A0A9P8YGC7_9PEZI|nr:zinc finger protein-domain-containing protein [Microdochium trichocladiopsis]KAH7038372.1 zinc finger protein-domain-containing protein [Microdochium trichocladiopsis]